MLISFFFSFIIFKRDFNYYLALFLPFFYLLIAQKLNFKIIKNKLFLSSVVFCLIITLIENRVFSLSSGSISNQVKLAEIIAKTSTDRTFSLRSTPHYEYRNGVLYLLKFVHKFKEDESSMNRFEICYDQCSKKNPVWSNKTVTLYKE